MKIKTTVLCLPVNDLQKTLVFYKGVFGFPDVKIEESILALEFPNMSLFLMEQESFESYTKKANRAALFPGGASPGAASIDPSFGGYIGYVSDPDGHLWELVWPNHQ